MFLAAKDPLTSVRVSVKTGHSMIAVQEPAVVIEPLHTQRLTWRFRGELGSDPGRNGLDRGLTDRVFGVDRIAP
jgi:hypothetical protein